MTTASTTNLNHTHGMKKLAVNDCNLTLHHQRDNIDAESTMEASLGQNKQYHIRYDPDLFKLNSNGQQIVLKRKKEFIILSCEVEDGRSCLYVNSMLQIQELSNEGMATTHMQLTNYIQLLKIQL